MAQSPLIVVDRVHKSFGSGDTATRVIRGVSFTVDANSLTAIVGPSGCGKTTMLNLLGGLDAPDEGTIEVDGIEIAGLDRKQLTVYRRDKLGFVFQFFNLLPTLTAVENVETGLEVLGIPRKQRRQRALEYLDRVGLADWAERFPAQLSGGQQQRVSIARAVAREPSVLLADEPTGNLDQESGATELEIIGDLQRELGVTCIMVTHDRGIAATADSVVRFCDGKIVGTEDGASEDEASDSVPYLNVVS